MYDDNSELFGQLVDALAITVVAKDKYTSGHSKRVARYASMLAAAMGLGAQEQESIYRAGLLHDIGKIRISDEIINKPSRLTDEEFQIIQMHTIAGYHILRGITAAPEMAEAAKYHHERYDGSGYPDGLTGDNIPRIARIIGVADAYDAMASNRSYRSALPQDVIRQEIAKGMGSQFDPAPARAMLDIIGNDVDYALRQAELKQKQILVVDDETLNIQMVRNILKDEPLLHLLAASSGQEALMILEAVPVDLVLLDIEMPGMDGFETMKHIRASYDMPVIFVSAEKRYKVIKRAEASGVAEYLTKPFLPMALKEIIHDCLMSE